MSFVVIGGADFEEISDLIEKSLMLSLVLIYIRDKNIDNINFLLMSHRNERIPSY